MDRERIDDLSSEREIRFPPLFAINEYLDGNRVQQLIQPGYRAVVAVEVYHKHRVKGFLLKPVQCEPTLLIWNTRIRQNGSPEFCG